MTLHAPCSMRTAARVAPGAFTLIEVLVALALVAAVAGVAMQGVALSLRLAADARRRSEAAQLAHSKLEELAATGQWQSGALSGGFEAPWNAYRWDASVQPWNDTALSQLDVEVTWQDRRQAKSVTMTTLVVGGGP